MFNTKPWNSGFPGIPKEIEELQTITKGLDKSMTDMGTYSSTEVMVGYWGTAPLYRKLFNFGTLPNNDTKTISINVPDITVRYFEAFASSGSLLFRLPNASSTAADVISASINKSNNTCVVTTASDKSNLGGGFLVYYTKNPSTKDGDTEPEKEPEKEPEEPVKKTSKSKKGE